jgi:hypothetical protein
MTSASARASLIACRNVGARGNDHTWNEFYDRRWVQWEPVNTYVEHYYYYVDEDGNYYYQKDGKDNNCDGVADFGDDTNDNDGDGFSESKGDCNDTDTDIYPFADEIDDGTDNDCDGIADDGTSTDDMDGDGYSIYDGDCDDTDSNIYPSAEDPPPSNNRIYSVTAWRGDDMMWDITERYGTTFTLQVFAKDKDGLPIDGGIITIWGPILVYPEYSDYIWFVSGGTTDMDGFAEFILGEANTYYIRIDTDIGSDPKTEGYVTEIVEWSEPGETVVWEPNIRGNMPSMSVEESGEKYEPSDIRLDVSWNFDTYYLHGKNPLFFAYDAGDSTYTERREGGKVDVIIFNSQEYGKFSSGASVDALRYVKGSSNGNASIMLPKGGSPFYIVFSNLLTLSSTQSGSIKIHSYSRCNKEGEGCREDAEFSDNVLIPEGDFYSLKIEIRE